MEGTWNDSYEVSHNVFQENVASDIGAAVALPLLTVFTHTTQNVTMFKNK